MTDVFTIKKRSEVMSKIKSKDTKPEILLRKELHRLGYRFRLHVKELPGKPDIVMPKYNTVIQVRGCFWHGHKNCEDGHIPKSRLEYWVPKLKQNKIRDRKNDRRLRQMGWQTITVWECKLSNAIKREVELTRIVNYLERQ